MFLVEVLVCNTLVFCHLLRISVQCLPTLETCGPTKATVKIDSWISAGGAQSNNFAIMVSGLEAPLL